MTPPNAATTTNVEDEMRAMRPVAIIPVIEDTESEDESSANLNLGEEAPQVEEVNDDAEEGEEDTDSPAASLTSHVVSPISPHINHHNSPPVSPVVPTEPQNNYHTGESSRGTIRPRQNDPYMGFAPRQRTHSPERVPYHTTPAMYSLSGDPYHMPTLPTVPQYNPDFNLQIHYELQTMRNQQRDLHERQLFLEEMSVIESERTRLRLDGFEVELMRLRSILGSLSARLTRLEDVNHGRRM